MITDNSSERFFGADVFITVDVAVPGLETLREAAVSEYNSDVVTKNITEC